MQRYKILWADDEIDLLKPHILFLTDKGYDITPVPSGADAIDACENVFFDLIFLDENMPGMTGLETLAHLKVHQPNTPVIMITKSEEEHIMEEAIGAKIADYLIKPLNPNQILLSVKKILDKQRLVSEKTNLEYQQDFRNLSMAFGDNLDFNEWIEVYRKLIFWELEIDNSQNNSMLEVLDMQKTEANSAFSRFVMDHYESWLNDPNIERPVMSHNLMRKMVFPNLEAERPMFFLVIDNLRFDQWKTIEPLVAEYFNIESEDAIYSILPTTTAYSRNSIFSGMMPDEMASKHPDLWVTESDDEGKNNSEGEFLSRQIERLKLDVKYSYHKIINAGQGKQLLNSFNNLLRNDLNVVVFNFVDMLSHARTDMNMIKELAPDESAYRSITKSWFMHSPLFELLKRLANSKTKVMIATDHGTIRVKRPFKIVGDRTVNSNLRYKQGKNLGFDGTDIYVCRDPEKIHLPKINMSTSYVFAIENQFFAYPNNYNYFVRFYDDTFQHGGISMEEMIIPVISLNSKNE